jgi:very-short-patch-repair endonuclease
MRALAIAGKIKNHDQMAMLTPQQRERGRRLRRMDSASEQRLWAQLRGRRLAGLKFVRQLPVENYVVDFACRERRLVVEVDGATHSTSEEAAYDARRTACLELQGWRVLRVTNDDVSNRLDGVLESIMRACLPPRWK